MTDRLIPASARDGCLQHGEWECNEFRIINTYKLLQNEPISSVAMTEIKIMCKLAIPVCLTSMSSIIMWNTDQVFLGHLGTKQLAGAALADVCMEILTLFVYSPGCSLNSLCSQALGSGNTIMAGYWFQLGIIICTIITLPVYVGYFFVGDLISLVSTDGAVINFSKLFAHYSALFLWSSAMMTCIQLFHQSLEIVYPFLFISVFAIIMNIIGNQLWIYGLNVNLFNGAIKIEFDGLGFIGSPLATSTSMLLQLFLYYIWCFVIKKYHIKHKTWNGWSLKQTICHLKRCKAFLKVVVPNAIGDASENWAYQVLNLYAATLEAAEIAALSCTFAVWGILWSFYSGIGMSIITRVGKAIASDNVRDAKLVTKVGLLLSLMVSSSIAMTVYLCTDYLCMIYSSDRNVQNIMKQCIPYLCAMYVIGSCGWCAQNVLEAMSENRKKAFICVGTAWFGYVPLSIYFMDNNELLNKAPVACIFVVGLLVETIRTLALWITLMNVDWKKCCIEAQQRNERHQHDLKQNNTKLKPALLNSQNEAATAV